jgi:hypothetical protein
MKTIRVFRTLILAALVCVAIAAPSPAQDRETPLPTSVQRFLTAKTIAVGWIDISKLNLDAFAKFTEKINGSSQNMNEAKTIRDALVQLGVTRIYWTTDLAGLMQGPQAVIVPVPAEKSEMIATILRAVVAQAKGVAVVDNNVVLAGNADIVKQLQTQQNNGVSPTLLAAVSRVEYPHGLVVMTPISAILPIVALLPQLADGDADRAAKAAELLVNLQSVTISGELPPSNATIRISTKSTEVAQGLTNLINAWTNDRIPDASTAIQLAPDGDDAVLKIKSTDQAIGVVSAIQMLSTGTSRPNSLNSLQQIAIAMHNFHDTYGHFPPQALADAKGNRLLSWRVMVLPYLDQLPLYKEFHLDEPWDSDHNIKLIAKMPAVFKSQVQQGAQPEPGKTRFAAPLTFNSTFGRVGPGVRIQDIKDGTSNTLMIVESSAEKAVIWTKPEDLIIDDTDPLHSIINQDDNGFAACMCDGSARFFSKSIDLNTLKALLSIDLEDNVGKIE